jgi:hypothetical protein
MARKWQENDAMARKWREIMAKGLAVADGRGGGHQTALFLTGYGERSSPAVRQTF